MAKTHLTEIRPAVTAGILLYQWKCRIAYYTSPQPDAYKADCKKCLNKVRAEKDSKP